FALGLAYASAAREVEAYDDVERALSYVLSAGDAPELDSTVLAKALVELVSLQVANGRTGDARRSFETYSAILATRQFDSEQARAVATLHRARAAFAAGLAAAEVESLIHEASGVPVPLDDPDCRVLLSTLLSLAQELNDAGQHPLAISAYRPIAEQEAPKGEATLALYHRIRLRVARMMRTERAYIQSAAMSEPTRAYYDAQKPLTDTLRRAARLECAFARYNMALESKAPDDAMAGIAALTGYVEACNAAHGRDDPITIEAEILRLVLRKFLIDSTKSRDALEQEWQSMHDRSVRVAGADGSSTLTVLNSMALFYAHVGEPDTAIDYIDRAIAANDPVHGPSPIYLDTKAEILAGIGDYKTAVALQQRVVEIAPEGVYPGIYKRLADYQVALAGSRETASP
ncbi:MAG: tetratricopeptide repeat protein, partial [Planctomycetota bacterium]